MGISGRELTELNKICIRCEWNYQLHYYIDQCSKCKDRIRLEGNKRGTLMGLDFSHGEAHFSYSGFKTFRCNLWNECGFTGNLYDLYNENKYMDQIRKEHPLFELFNHSDCGGYLSPNQMKIIIPAIKKHTSQWTHTNYNYNESKNFLDGMIEAVKLNENFEFS